MWYLKQWDTITYVNRHRESGYNSVKGVDNYNTITNVTYEDWPLWILIIGNISLIHIRICQNIKYRVNCYITVYTVVKNHVLFKMNPKNIIFLLFYFF